MASIIDYILPEDKAEYMAIIERAAEAKANAPKERKPRAPMTEEQWKNVGDALENLKKFSQLYCTGCGYCQPCPKGIKIPEIFKAYTYHNVYGLHDLATRTYDRYIHNEKQPGATSNDCVGCGYCEKKCPQHLKVRQLLKMAESALEAL